MKHPEGEYRWRRSPSELGTLALSQLGLPSLTQGWQTVSVAWLSERQTPQLRGCCFSIWQQFFPRDLRRCGKILGPCIHQHLTRACEESEAILEETRAASNNEESKKRESKKVGMGSTGQVAWSLLIASLTGAWDGHGVKIGI